MYLIFCNYGRDTTHCTTRASEKAYINNINLFHNYRKSVNVIKNKKIYNYKYVYI
jgi:hypothetical protein